MFNTEAICKYDVPISIRISNNYEYLFKFKKNLHAPLINLNSSNDKHPHQNSNMPSG